MGATTRRMRSCSDSMHAPSCPGLRERDVTHAKIRDVRVLTDGIAIPRGAVGILAGQTGLNPDVDALHALVAVRRSGNWRIALFENAPAQYHGRLDAVEASPPTCAGCSETPIAARSAPAQ
jgi:hypothetical protein